MRLTDPVLRLSFVRRDAKRSAGLDAEADNIRRPRPFSRPPFRGTEFRANPVAAPRVSSTRQAPPSQAINEAPAPTASFRVNPPASFRVASIRRAIPPQSIRKVLENSMDFRVNPPKTSPLASTSQAPPAQPMPSAPEPRRSGPISRLFALLRGGASMPRKLRLAETVALGEKRFVAIIDAEGCKYLIGGGTTGVALLTRLEDSIKPIEKLARFENTSEAAG
jgi:hypothetical protein